LKKEKWISSERQCPIEIFSSVSAVSSKVPVVNPGPSIDPVAVDEVAIELKASGSLPSVEVKLRVLDSALVALEKPGFRGIAGNISTLAGVQIPPLPRFNIVNKQPSVKVLV
jgi:hypothetical protein